MKKITYVLPSWSLLKILMSKKGVVHNTLLLVEPLLKQCCTQKKHFRKLKELSMYSSTSKLIIHNKLIFIRL